MRIENQYGNNIVCGHIFPADEIMPGQVWQASGGATVEIVSVNDGDVTSSLTEKGKRVEHTKASFAFQCRYCLILPNNPSEPRPGDARTQSQPTKGKQ